MSDLPEYPRSVEIHRFSADGRRMLLNVRTLIFFEISKLADSIINLCNGSNSRDEILASLTGNGYSETDVIECMSELEQAGILKKQDKVALSYKPPDSIPLEALALHVCHDCNLKCKYCYGEGGTYGGPRKYMDKKIAEKAVDFLIKESGEISECVIIFFGGEPLLNFELIKHVILYARETGKKYGKKVRFSMTTNGTLLTDEVISYLNREKIGVLISMDGYEKIQDRMRPFRNGKGSYKSIVPKAQKFISSRRGRVSVRATFTREDLHLLSITKHLTDLGFGVVHLCPVSGSEYKLSSRDMARIGKEFEKMAEYFMEMVRKGYAGSVGIFRKFLNQFHHPRGRLFPCGGGIKYLAVSPDGDIYLCHRFVGEERFKIGNVMGEWDKSLQRMLLANDVDSRSKCKNCWARYICGGGCYAHAYYTNGDIFTPDELMCAFTKRVIELSIALYVKIYEENREILDRLGLSGRAKTKLYQTEEEVVKW